MPAKAFLLKKIFHTHGTPYPDKYLLQLGKFQSEQIHLLTKASQNMNDCTLPIIYQLRLLKGSLALVVTNSYDHKDVLCFTDPSDQKGCQKRLLAKVGPRQGKRGGKRDRYQSKHKYVIIS